MDWQRDRPHSGDGDEQLIELGWLIVSNLEKVYLEAVDQGRREMLELLSQQFDQFEWRMPMVQRSGPAQRKHEEPAFLLDEGVTERDIRHWDFAFVITSADLNSYYTPYALATPSRAVSVAAISTARLSPEQPALLTDRDERVSVMANRVCVLGMHLLGDLNGLSHRDEPEAFMHRPEEVGELDDMAEYSLEEKGQMIMELSQVADARLEETPQAEQSGVLPFYLKAAWIGCDDIASAVVQAKPWEFPFRLSRLTAVAISTMLVLLMTAEAWELGMSQSWQFVLGLSLLALVGGSTFVLKRQKLLVHRGPRRLTEQTVFTNMSTSILVFVGMTTVYLMLFLLALLLSVTMFSPGLVEGWAASVGASIRVRHYLVLAGFVASLGVLIGALGASMEGQQYFRHITFVDEET